MVGEKVIAYIPEGFYEQLRKQKGEQTLTVRVDPSTASEIQKTKYSIDENEAVVLQNPRLAYHSEQAGFGRLRLDDMLTKIGENAEIRRENLEAALGDLTHAIRIYKKSDWMQRGWSLSGIKAASDRLASLDPQTNELMQRLANHWKKK